MPAARQLSVRTRTHTSSFGLTRLSISPSPNVSRSSWTTRSRTASPGSAGVSSTTVASLNRTTTDHDGHADRGVDRLVLHQVLAAFAAPTGTHVLVLDPLLQQDDALEQRLGTWWTTR